ncbi:hypothetical protein PUN28_006720 [Cardiocondyla obscurior]|uniref:Uncharacterized protein n=1 Tax=Cardiocondyla obscurior TaxID=286306 RepID=A0AAW2G2W4_9HYME
MRLKIAWLPALIFCATLALVTADLDLGPIIKTAQCRSMCLRYHVDNCWKINKTDVQINHCRECWDTCQVLYSLEKIDRYITCAQQSYQDCQGCKTACTFFEIRQMEEEKYEPSKLPAPEENETIYVDDYDVAVLMTKNSAGAWEEENYYYAKQQLTMIPGSWVIVVTSDGVVKHYSWEKWRPKLQSLKAGGPLYQAYITWHDWRIQLKNQRKKSLNYFKTIFENSAAKKEHAKSSFVVTWQEKTGDGITGNQVTDSESAQISLPCGKYLVRVATDDGPGSYPITIETGDCEILNQTSFWYLNKHAINIKMYIYILPLSGILISCVIMLCLFKKFRIKRGKESRMEEGCLTESEKRLMKEGILAKVQKKPTNQEVLTLWSNCGHTAVDPPRIDEANTNVNESVRTQDAKSVIQKT